MVSTVVAKVSRIDWLRNNAGLVDHNCGRGTLSPRPVLDWYLKRVDDAVQEAKELSQDEVYHIAIQLLRKSEIVEERREMDSIKVAKDNVPRKSHQKLLSSLHMRFFLEATLKRNTRLNPFRTFVLDPCHPVSKDA
ncbi:hypothetical protein ACFX1X_028244 [Malus domestica]